MRGPRARRSALERPRAGLARWRPGGRCNRTGIERRRRSAPRTQLDRAARTDPHAPRDVACALESFCSPDRDESCCSLWRQGDLTRPAAHTRQGASDQLPADRAPTRMETSFRYPERGFRRWPRRVAGTGDQTACQKSGRAGDAVAQAKATSVAVELSPPSRRLRPYGDHASAWAQLPRSEQVLPARPSAFGQARSSSPWCGAPRCIQALPSGNRP